MLSLLDADPVKHLQLTQVKDAVDAVVLITGEVVAGDVEDDEAGELLQLDDLLDVRDQVVAQVELHQRLQSVQPVQLLDLVVLHRQLGQRLQLAQPALDPPDPVPPQIQFLQIP